MSALAELFALGGHGAYLVGAYAIGGLALVAECIEVMLRRRNVLAHLDRLGAPEATE